MSAFEPGVAKGLVLKHRYVDMSDYYDYTDPVIQNVVSIKISPFVVPQMPQGAYLTDPNGLPYAHQHPDSYTKGSTRRITIADEYLVARPDGAGLPTELHAVLLDNICVLKLSPSAATDTSASIETLDGSVLGEFMCQISLGDKYSIAPGRLIATPLNDITFNAPVASISIQPFLMNPTSGIKMGGYGNIMATFGYIGDLGVMYVAIPNSEYAYSVLSVGDRVKFTIDVYSGDASPALVNYKFGRNGLIVYKKYQATATETRWLLSPMPRALKSILDANYGTTANAYIFGAGHVNPVASCLKFLLTYTSVDNGNTQSATPVAPQ